MQKIVLPVRQDNNGVKFLSQFCEFCGSDWQNMGSHHKGCKAKQLVESGVEVVNPCAHPGCSNHAVNRGLCGGHAAWRNWEAQKARMV